MNLSEFIKLDSVTRAEKVVDKGILVDSYVDGELVLQIYYYAGFFVEISFNASKNTVDATPFKNGYHKEQYPILGIQN